MKKYHLLLYFLIFILSISFVYAQDNDTELGVNSYEVDNYRDLKNIAELESCVINLTKDVEKDDYSAIISSQNLTINGNGHTIDAKNMGRIFSIPSQSTLYLNNLKLTNGLVTNWENGGCILNYGNLYIKDCTFSNNVAGHDGGVISCDGAFTSISGTNVFSNNVAHNDAGVIYNYDSVLNITGKNTFDNNKAISNEMGKGGAILNVFKNAKLYISGENTFSNNQAKFDAGAIFNHQAFANITGKNTFINNKATGGEGKGGAINNENATLYLSGNNIFKSNYAFRGGAIDNSLFDAKLTISGKNEFTGNKGYMGGALANQESKYLNLLGENTFTSNRADNIGGAIYSYIGPLNINSKSTFSKNTAENTGGAIFSANNNAMIDGTNTFTSNSAREGGALILVDSQSVGIKGHNTFDSNTASSAGGAIRARNVGNLILGNHNYFRSNKASHSGGAIYVESSTLDTKGALYESNSAIYGGAIFLHKTSFAGTYNIFKNNVATGTGSDIESYESSIHSLEYNYWNSQNKVSQNNIHSYSVSNIKTWVVIDFTIPSQIKQYSDTEIVRFKTNSFTNLNGEMPNYVVKATPNFDPTNIEITKNVGKSKYMGNTGRVTVHVESSNFGGIKDVNVVEGKVKTSLKGNDILLEKPNQNANYEAVLSDADGKKLSGKTITITVDGKKYTQKTNNQGKVSLQLTNLANGYHEIVSVYSGENNYFESSTTNGIICIFENQSNTKLTGKDVVMYYKDGSKYELTLTDANNKPLASKATKLYINGVIYQRTTDANGKASMVLNLNSGTSNIIACYPGDSVNKFVYTNNTITIKSTVYGNDLVKYFKNDSQYYAKFLDSKGKALKNTPITFNINGVFYTRTTNESGYARMNINLYPGTYIITANNPINGEQHSNKVTVLNVLEGNDLTKYFRNDSQYAVKVLGQNGKPIGPGKEVKFNINGVFYTRTTNESGYARMNINLYPGTYIITAEYNGLFHSNTITVKPTLYGKNIDMKYLDGTQYEVTLVDKQGKPISKANITLNINGVFYHRNTDDNGVARLNLKLMAGKYIITATYEDAITSNTITIR